MVIYKKQTFAFFRVAAITIILCWFPFGAKAETSAEESKFITELKVIADKGDAEAQYNLGNSYYVGIGVTKNYNEAAKWLTKAAEQGYAKAESSLGTMYYNGFGVPKNISEALKWWNKAADHHNADAQDQLGFAYLLGDGVQKDYIKAYMWFNIAAANKDAHAVQDRDKVAKYMVSEEIAEAQRIQTEWAQSHP